jgi:universal protein Kae1
MICLGIESSAHTFGIGIVDDKGNILANEKSVYKPSVGKGIIPMDAANFHKMNCEKVLENALNKSKLKMDDIDIVAYVAGAGMAPCLLVGADFAAEVSKKYNKTLVPVCHQVAHLEIGKLTTQTKDPIFLYLSGGNTQIIAFTEGRYRIFGETEDIPIGNALDSLAREIGLEPPYGPNFDKAAENGKKYIELPYVVKGMDLSFTGILTAALNRFKNGASKEDICYSMQETCFAMVTEVTERALAHTAKGEVLLIGGVASSKRMQDMIKTMCEERSAKMFVVPQEFAVDNGANIAWTGILVHNSGWKQKIKDKIKPNWRIDDVEITWLK